MVRVESRRSTDLIDITELLEEVLSKSGVREGFITVYTMHTTTGVTVNEGEPGLEEDVVRFLRGMVAEDLHYRHHHFFRKDGRMAVNAWAHLRSIILGMHTSLPVAEGRIVRGGRQRVYLVELDGPQARSIYIQVVGV